jgi:putative colanic acid biosynthesis UDP-glucose lipid carrier transferase
VDPLRVFNLRASYELPLFPVDRAIPLEDPTNGLFKRSFDVLISVIFTVCLFSWLLPIIAFIIRLDSKGPVFFFKKRHKRNGETFTCIKFRTMVINDSCDILAAVDNDPRITRVGRFLRKHHLDELPQLLNVLAGDMSMVGPRPYMIKDNEKYENLIKHYGMRERVKPGITGLAQVIEYVNPVTNIEYMEQRIKKDVYYVYNWSLALDVKILGRTLFKILRGK